MSQNLVLVNHENPEIALFTLNRPDKRNALNIELLEQLSKELEALHQSSSTRVLVLTGAGPAFCTGMDLKEAASNSNPEYSAQLIAKVLASIYTSRLVTIAAVHGMAIAGGAGIMSACDFVIAAHGTRIGYPETRRGLVAAQVATLLCRQLRLRDIRELLLLGELIGTERALAMGLINRSVPPETLASEAMKFAEIVLQGAPEATAETKRLLDALGPKTLDDDLKIAMHFHHQARQSSEAKEGIAAFFESRKPAWIEKHQ